MKPDYPNRTRIYSYVTRTKFFHVEDAFDIGKVRVFAGSYEKGKGASEHTAHFIDVTDARVLFADLAWGKPVDYCEFKGSHGNSRVLKVKTKHTGENGRVWFSLENGPGQAIGNGAVKPDGEPDIVVNIPFPIWESRKLGFAVVGYIQAHETHKEV